MDLIHMNENKEDVGVLQDYTFDLAFGKDENDFECKIISSNHCCEKGFFLYYEGSEYGGIIDDIGGDTDTDEITYSGRTWHGILNKKVIEPLKETDSSDIAIIHYDGKNLIDSNMTQGVIRGIGTYEDNSITITRNVTSGATYFFKDFTNLSVGKTYTVSADFSTNGMGAYLQASYVFIDEDGTLSFETISLEVKDGTEGSLALTFTPIKKSERIRISFLLRNQNAESGIELVFTEMQLEVGDIKTSYTPTKSLLNSYLMVSGEANEVLQYLIDRLGLSDLFRASVDDSGIFIKNYKMNRYISGYDGICKMLKEFGGKLHIIFKNGFVELSAKPVVDYSKDEQFDTDQIGFKFKKKGNPINHVICLGKGELADREVIHIYADKDGNISDTQVFFGIDEVTDTYENANAESSEELRQGGIDKIKEAWNSDELNFDFDSDEETYDIGDIVGAKEDVTGVEVSAEITKKIVSIKNNSTTISYEVGDKL